MENTFKLYADRQQSSNGILAAESNSTAPTWKQAIAECKEKFPEAEGWYGHAAVAR